MHMVAFALAALGLLLLLATRLSAKPQPAGVWLASGQVKGRPATDPESSGPGLEFIGVTGPSLGNLLDSREALGKTPKPVVFKAGLRNLTSKKTALVLSGEIFDEQGKTTALPARKIEIKADQSLEIPVSFKAPGYGWYGIKIKVKAGRQALEKQDAFCVLHPAALGTRPDSLFGLHLGDSDEDRRVAQAMGVKWRRGIPDTDIVTVSPEPGKWWGQAEIAKARQRLKEWKDSGILCLGYVNYNAAWNVEPDPLDRKIMRHQNRPHDLQAQADILYHLIKPLKDEVKVWETWNEPWIRSWTWRTGSAQDFRDMSRLIWEKVKPEMPEIQLVGGGSTSYLRDVVFAKGSSNTGYLDGITTHPYQRPDGNYCARAAVEAAMNKQCPGGGKAGIWATELGIPEEFFSSLPLTERRIRVARGLAPLYLLNRLGAGDTPMRVFYYHSFFNDQNDGANFWEMKTPRPVVAAYSAMSHFLEDASLKGDLWSETKLGWALRFTKPNGSSVVTLWVEEASKGKMTLPAKGWQAFDYLGRPLAAKGGKVVLPLESWQVSYLLTSKPAAQIKADLAAAGFEGIQPLRVIPRDFNEPVKAGVKLKVKVENLLPRPVDAVLTIKASAGLVLKISKVEITGLKPGEVRYPEFEIVKAKPSANNRYAIGYQAKAGALAQKGSQSIQAAFAAYGTPVMDGQRDGWSGFPAVTMLSRGGKDFQRILLNPDLAEKLLKENSGGDTVAYKAWTAFDEKNFYMAVEVPDSTLMTNSTFEDDPYGIIVYVDCLQLAFHALERNPDDLIFGHPLGHKGALFDADYEFAATLARATGDGPGYAEKPAWKGDLEKAKQVPQIQRMRAPGTNCQTFYPTNAQTNPLLGAMQATPEGGPEGKVKISYDAKAQVFFYEIALPWSQVPELGEKIKALKPGGKMAAGFAFAVFDNGGRGRTCWQQEAGDVEAGSYGFSPTWGGGAKENGGRITTEWGFVR